MSLENGGDKEMGIKKLMMMSKLVGHVGSLDIYIVVYEDPPL